MEQTKRYLYYNCVHDNVMLCRGIPSLCSIPKKKPRLPNPPKYTAQKTPSPLLFLIILWLCPQLRRLLP
jgi:hypothetical protein